MSIFAKNFERKEPKIREPFFNYYEDIQEKRAFSLMEMLIVMLIVAVVMAIQAPAFVKKKQATVTIHQIWRTLPGEDITWNTRNKNLSAIIGGKYADVENMKTGTVSNNYPGLIINTRDENPQLAFMYSDEPRGILSIQKGIALGNEITLSGDNSIAIGKNINIGEYKNSVASGYNATIEGHNSVAIGSLSKTAANSTAIGYSANSYSTNSVAVGNASVTESNNGLAIGNNATVTSATGAIAIGNSAEVKSGATSSVVIGSGANTTSGSSIVIGKEAKSSINSTVANTIAIGTKARVSAKDAIAIGYNANVTKEGSIALGSDIKSLYPSTTAIGYKAKVGNTYATAVGYNANASVKNALAIGASAKSGATGVTNTIAIGYNTNVTGNSAAAIGSGAFSKYANAIAIGYGANTSLVNSVVIGTNVTSNRTNSIALGKGANIDYMNAYAIGTNAYAKGTSFAFGYFANANGLSSVAIGPYATISNGAIGAAAIGNNTAASFNSLAIGSNAKASSSNTIAIGSGAKATATRAVAIGANSYAAGTDSISIMGNISEAVGKFSSLNATDNNVIILGGNDTTVYIPGNYEIGNIAYENIRVRGSVLIDNHLVTKKGAALGVYQPGSSTANFASNNANHAGTWIKSFHRNDVFGSEITKADGSKETKEGFRGYGTYVMDTNGGEWDFEKDRRQYEPSGLIALRYGIYHSFPGASWDIPDWSGWWTSDIRLKDIIGENLDAMDKINKLKVYNYTYKNDPNKTPHVGVMAQHLKKIFPNAVSKDENGFLQIRHEEIFFAMVNALKQLDAKVKEIAAKLAENIKLVTSNEAKITARDIEIKELKQEVANLRELAKQLPQ